MPSTMPSTSTDAWKAAVEQFTADLNPQEKSILSKSSLADILDDVVRFEQSHRKSSKVRRVSLRLQPFVDAINDYGKALDVVANTSCVIPPLWGSLRVLVLVSPHCSAGLEW